MPLISVIVPVYKVEQYLNRCVDSILAQTFTDFELILVDDGSPDNCGAICDEYAEKDSRIHVIHQKNGGLSAARNAGIDWAFANSDSQWLSFIDSDDWVHPCFLEYLYRAVQETGAKVSACQFERVEGQGAFPVLEYFCEIMDWTPFYVSDPVIGVVAWNKLYNKKLFKRKRYPVGKIHEDEYLTYRLLYAAKTVAYVPVELLYYYQNPDGIMKKKFSLSRLDKLPAFEKQLRFAKITRNKAFFDYRLQAYFSCLRNYYNIITKNPDLTNDEKDELLRIIHPFFRRFLIRFGKKMAPYNSKLVYYYNQCFPRLVRLSKVTKEKAIWIYWVFRGIVGKPKRFYQKLFAKKK